MDADALLCDSRRVSIEDAECVAQESARGFGHERVAVAEAEDDGHRYVVYAGLAHYVVAELECGLPERLSVRAHDHVQHALLPSAAAPAALVVRIRVTILCVDVAVEELVPCTFFCCVGQWRADGPPYLRPWDADAQAELVVKAVSRVNPVVLAVRPYVSDADAFVVLYERGKVCGDLVDVEIRESAYVVAVVVGPWLSRRLALSCTSPR